MKRKLAKLSLVILSLIVGIGFLAPLPVFADESGNTSESSDICENGDVPEAVRKANGCNPSAENLKPAVINIINVVMGVIGLVAVIVIIIGGIQYMTSIGDTNKTTKARNTILYAVIGLIVIILSAIIVNTVITAVISSSSTSTAEEEQIQ